MSTRTGRTISAGVLAVLLAIGLGFLAVRTDRSRTDSVIERTPSGQILVSPDWIEAHRDEITILEYGRNYRQFETGHIPGAAFVPLEAAWDTVDGISGMLPDPELVAADLEDAGVSNGQPVVIYDAGNGLWASRLFWALEYLGHTRVHLLNGGLSAWNSAGLPVSNVVNAPERGEFTPRVRPELVAGRDEILTGIENRSFAILDARSPAEFTGQDVRSARGGHILGSVNIDWVHNLTDEGSFKTTEALTELYREVVGAGSGPAVALCQTGVRGAHTYLALRILGHEEIRVYDGSWAEWGNDPDLPIVEGS